MSNHDEMQHMLTERSLPRTRVGAGRSDLDQDQGSGSTAVGTSATENPSSVPRRNRLSETGNFESCPRCIEERRRADAILTDLQNAQADVLAKMRQIGALKAELARQRDEDPEGQEVKELLVYAKQKLGKRTNWSIALDGDRAKLAKKVLKRYGADRCKKAIDGLAAKPHAGPRGRSASPYPGSKRYDELSHCWGDDERFTNCEQIIEELERPTLEAVPEPVAPVETKLVATEEGWFKAVPLTPAEQARKDREAAERAERTRIIGDERPPIDRVLQALHTVTGWFPRPAETNRDTWMARCPTHDDRSPSLRVSRRPDGTVLMFCIAGCHTDDLIRALGLDWRDLWDRSELDSAAADYVDPQIKPARRIPAHLESAMRDLLARDERKAA